MGKSFVMKRPDGALAGYLMQGDGEIRFRANALPDVGAALTLVFAGGAQERREARGEREMVWPDQGKDVEAAYVAGGETLLMCTGEQGRRAFHAAQAREKARRQEKTQAGRQAPPETAQEPEAAGSGAQREAKYAMPERRWPPPPCLPGARYRQGGWRTEEAVRNSADAGRERRGEAPQHAGL